MRIVVPRRYDVHVRETELSRQVDWDRASLRIKWRRRNSVDWARSLNRAFYEYWTFGVTT